jgi:tetratricopeptide (TPR) repeat protein
MLALARVELSRDRIEPAFLHLLAYTEAFPDDVAGWVALADVRAKAGQPQEEEAALTQAVQLDPGRDRLRTRRASVRSRIGRHHGAIVDAQAALQRDLADADAAAILRSELARTRDVAAARGEVALSTRSGAAENWPGTLGPMIRDFLAELKARRWTEATRIAHSAREEYRDSMLGAWLEGVVAYSAGELTQAAERFEEALKVSPRSHRALTNLVPLWSKQGGPENAAQRLVALTDADPGFTYPLPIAARAWLEAAQPARAEATIRRMFTLLPASPVPYREVATFYVLVDRSSEVISTAGDGLSRFPGDAELHLLEARARLLLGDREGAIRAFEAALAVRPDDQMAAAQLARLLVTARQDAASHARALALVRDLELDAPAGAEVLAAMGIVTSRLGKDPQRARRWLEAAKALGTDDPELAREMAQSPR